MATEREVDDYIKLVWTGWSQAVFQAQKQLVTWLFTLHGAGIAGTLGFANSRGVHCSVVLALVAFGVGIVSLLLWATLMYYFGVARFRAMKRDVAAYESQKMRAEAFVENESRRSAEYRSCEIIAWISGLAALMGLISLVLAVTWV
ncbi:MAG TPA: hypothetical protein VGQ95_08160 [Chthoniobacterales bacterium]|nr:hypothetical protein [Chthoniobacterales bacterium]